MTIPASVMQQIGIKVTTVSDLGGIGLGYILPSEYWKDGKGPENVAFQSGGNGHFYPTQFAETKVDGGDGYVAAIAGIGLGHYFNQS